MRVSIAPLPFLPVVVSVSRLPKRLPSTSSDLSWMPVRPRMFLTLAVRFGLPCLSYFMPWRQCPASFLLPSARTYRHVSPCDMGTCLPSSCTPATCFGDRSSRLTCSNTSHTTMLSLQLFPVVVCAAPWSSPESYSTGTSRFQFCRAWARGRRLTGLRPLTGRFPFPAVFFCNGTKKLRPLFRSYLAVVHGNTNQ